jgi:hypothetical protein
MVVLSQTHIYLIKFLTLHMQSQKYTGRNQLINRLASQVGSKDMAIGILKKSGDLTESGKFTAKGARRNAMTAGERAVDRASKSSSHSKNEYIYNSETNRATLKNK